MGETGISTVEEAFAAAKAEAGAVEESAGAPPVEAPATPPETADDQPGTNPDTQALLDSLVEQPEASGDPAEPGSDAWWQQEVELNGEQIQLKDLRDSGLRHADYTRKTQELAEQRRQLGEAAKFHEEFLTDPEGFAKTLAVKYGWVDETQTGPIMEIDLPNVLTQDEIDAKVNELVEERLASDPRVQEAQVIEAQRQIDAEFSRLEEVVGASINQKLRDSLLAEARERQVYDLEVLLKARLAGQLEKRRTSEELARSGTSRPASAGGLGSDPNEGAAPQHPATVEEAWILAKAEQAAS